MESGLRGKSAAASSSILSLTVSNYMPADSYLVLSDGAIWISLLQRNGDSKTDAGYRAIAPKVARAVAADGQGKPEVRSSALVLAVFISLCSLCPCALWSYSTPFYVSPSHPTNSHDSRRHIRPSQPKF